MPFDGATTRAGSPPPPTAPRGRDERPRRETPVIAPSIVHAEHCTHEHWRGMITIRYQIMELWDWSHVTAGPSDDPEILRQLRESGRPILRSARVDSPVYREWLSLYHTPGEILPHIQWGGAVEAIPGGDGGKGYAEWRLHALGLW